jgi:hypothetical protein
MAVKKATPPPAPPKPVKATMRAAKLEGVAPPAPPKVSSAPAKGLREEPSLKVGARTGRMTSKKPNMEEVGKTEKPKFKIPKTVGACADRLYELRALKSEAQKAVDAIEAEYNAIKEYVIETLPKSESSGVAGAVGRVTVVKKEVPQVEDWSLFYAYVARTKSFELLQKRLGEGAIKERIEAGKKIPGMGSFTAVTISLTKA